MTLLVLEDHQRLSSRGVMDPPVRHFQAPALGFVAQMRQSVEIAALEGSLPDKRNAAFLGLVLGMTGPGRIRADVAVLGVFQKSSGQARMQRVRSGHCGGEIVNDQIARHAAKKAHVSSKPAITSSSFWLCVGQTKQCREYDSTMISARTTLRLPVAGSLIIPNLTKSASAISPGSVSAIRTMRTLRPPQFRFRINRRNDVHDTLQPAPPVTPEPASPSTGRR